MLSRQVPLLYPSTLQHRRSPRRAARAPQALPRTIHYTSARALQTPLTPAAIGALSSAHNTYGCEPRRAAAAAAARPGRVPARPLLRGACRGKTLSSQSALSTLIKHDSEYKPPRRSERPTHYIAAACEPAAPAIMASWSVPSMVRVSARHVASARAHPAARLPERARALPVTARHRPPPLIP